MDDFLEDITAHSIKMLDKAKKFQNDNFVNLPSKLYHFVPSLMVLNSILKNREMWASHSYDMADKMELWYGAQLLLERIEKFKAELPNSNDAVREFFEMAADVANPYTNNYTGAAHTFILSFTEEGDSAHQWENYANKNMGFCLEFEATHIDWVNWYREYNLQLVRVKYERQEQIRLIDELIQEQLDFIQYAEKYPNGMFAAMTTSVSAVDVLKYYVMSFKQGRDRKYDYSSENEWRLVYGMRGIGPYLMPDPFQVNVRPDGAAEKRYIKVPLDTMKGLITFARIRIGKKATSEDRQKAEESEMNYFSALT